MAEVVILGAGGFGTALAVHEARMGHRVTLWSLFEEEIRTLKADGENKKLLPGIAIPKEVELTNDLSCIERAKMAVLAVPSFAVRETAKRIAGKINPHAVAVNVAKGLEPHTLKRLSVVLKEELPDCEIVVLSGPSHAEEVGREMPTTVVAAGHDRAATETVQHLMMNRSLRIYCNDDVVGVELGGALKNIIALAAGIIDGLGYGDNTKAALMTRGMAEISRLGVAMGARSSTFSGLTGIGDLIVTCTSMHSRNRRAGILIGEGVSAKEAVARIGMTVEGYIASESAYRLAQQTGVEMPIISGVYQILYENRSPRDVIEQLMGRPKACESEEVWGVR